MIIRIEVEINPGNLDPGIVIKALEPDNIDVPSGVAINMERRGGSVLIAIVCVEDKILTCRSTADEILMLISSAIKSVSQLTSKNTR